MSDNSYTSILLLIYYQRLNTNDDRVFSLNQKKNNILNNDDDKLLLLLTTKTFLQIGIFLTMRAYLVTFDNFFSAISYCSSLLS